MKKSMETPKTVQNEYRIGQLESNYLDLDKKIDKIMTTDLPHLELAINGVKTEVRVLFAANLVLAGLTIIIAKLLG